LLAQIFLKISFKIYRCTTRYAMHYRWLIYIFILMSAEAIMVISEIQADIRSVQEDMALYDETNFDSRAKAIDFIEFHIIYRLEGLVQHDGPNENLEILKQHAEKLKYRLEKIDTELFKQLRENIRTGSYTPSTFKNMAGRYTGYNLCDIDQSDTIGYDNLDVFINGLLGGQPIPEAKTELEPEMVFYQKTPARIIFELADLAEIKQDDVFFDLGSGLGQVALLMNLISDVPAIGIEFEPAYCNYANACALQLNLANVKFKNEDARKGDYALGTIFFMYTPFEGLILQNVLDILRQESQKRMIIIFTYGPCSPHVARQNWLNCVNGIVDNPYKLYEFRSLTNLA